MGMTCSAAIIVGLKREDLEEHENFEDYVNGLLLASASPYYDGWQDAIFGIIVAQCDTYSASEISGDINSRISDARESFKRITGLEGKVFITPDVC